jgi:hypothetical protein
MSVFKLEELKTALNKLTIGVQNVPVEIKLDEAATLKFNLQVDISESATEPLGVEINPLDGKRFTGDELGFANETGPLLDQLVTYNKNQQNRLDVSIAVVSDEKSSVPKYKKDTLYCFLMGIILPYSVIGRKVEQPSEEPVRKTRRRDAEASAPPPVAPEECIVSWLYQVMIDPASHKQVHARTCFKDFFDNLPGDAKEPSWGTMFMQLFEKITEIVVQKYSTTPVVAGLVDDSFIIKCNQPVVFSDYRRLTGKLPWYEGYHYYMANSQQYGAALYRNTVAMAKAGVEDAFKKYRTDIEACFTQTVDTQKLGCDLCEDLKDFCSKTCLNSVIAREIVREIDESEKSGTCKALKWISDNANKETCFTKYNRHYNTQTIRFPEMVKRKVVFNDLVIRLKFFNV